MPRKLRQPKRRHAAILVNPRVFKFSDGTWSYHPRDEVYASREAAAEAWNQPGMRAAVWALTRRFTTPRAAQVHDGITCRAHNSLMWEVQFSAHCCGRDPFGLTAVLEAVAADRDAVSAFEAARPDAASEIAGALELLRADLDQIAAVTQALAAGEGLTYRQVEDRLGLNARVTYGITIEAA